MDFYAENSLISDYQLVSDPISGWLLDGRYDVLYIYIYIGAFNGNNGGVDVVMILSVGLMWNTWPPGCVICDMCVSYFEASLSTYMAPVAHISLFFEPYPSCKCPLCAALPLFLCRRMRKTTVRRTTPISSRRSVCDFGV